MTHIYGKYCTYPHFHSEGEYIEVDYLSSQDSSESSLEEGSSEFETIKIDPAKDGDYPLRVFPESGALPDEAFTLFVTRGETTITLAESVKITDIPSQPYIVRISEDEIEKITPVNVNIAPRTLNLGNKGLFSALIEIGKWG